MEKTEAAYIVDEYFGGLIRWVTLVPTRNPKYKPHRNLGQACSALAVNSTYAPKWPAKPAIIMNPDNKLFYLTEENGFIEVELPRQWNGSLTKHMKPIVEAELASILEKNNGKD